MSLIKQRHLSKTVEQRIGGNSISRCSGPIQSQFLVAERSLSLGGLNIQRSALNKSNKALRDFNRPHLSGFLLQRESW